jgi:hypothetical protein
MTKLYYVIFDNKDKPEPGLYLTHGFNLSVDKNWDYTQYVNFINYEGEVLLGDKIFVIYDTKEKVIVELYKDEEDIPESYERNMDIYSTNVLENLFDEVFTR